MKGMPRYRVLRLLPEHALKFREKPPRDPPYLLRESHYEAGVEVEAQTPYELWNKLQEQRETEDPPRAMGVGDAVCADGGELLLCNFWGFDPAAWRQAAQGEETPEGGGEAFDGPAAC